MLCYTLLLAALGAVASAQYAVQSVYQFPSPPAGRYINIENIALRKNGQFLLTIATGPSLYQLNPAAPTPQLITTLPAPVDSLTGIAETYPGSDVWVVAAGNFTFGPQVPGGLAGIPGTWQVWSIDLNGPQAVLKQIAAIPAAVALDGAAAVSGRKGSTILFADGGLGAIWSVDVRSGAFEVAIQDPLFANTADFSLGINGLKVRDGVAYFTNSAQRFFGKVALAYGKYYGKGVAAAGPVQKVAASPPPANLYAFDDFSLDYKGNAWVATPFNAVTAVSPDGTAQIVAGGGNDTTLVSPTSTAFDRSGCNLYITTGGQGGPPGMEKSGGVYLINLCKNDGKGWGGWGKWNGGHGGHAGKEFKA